MMTLLLEAMQVTGNEFYSDSTNPNILSLLSGQQVPSIASASA